MPKIGVAVVNHCLEVGPNDFENEERSKEEEYLGRGIHNHSHAYKRKKLGRARKARRRCREGRGLEKGEASRTRQRVPMNESLSQRAHMKKIRNLGEV